MSGKRFTVIYDGDCGVCVNLAGVLRKCDSDEELEITPSMRPLAERFYRWFARNRYRMACGRDCRSTAASKL